MEIKIQGNHLGNVKYQYLFQNAAVTIKMEVLCSFFCQNDTTS